MKTVKFTHFHAENFGKFQEPIQHELGNKVLISGQNGVGKSAIKRMIMYVLGTKDENGKEISGIRPHDENGVDIDGLTTVAELTLSVDGVENTLKRTCFQEKNRQGEYTGKDNLQYFVDDVKKGTKKAYDEFVQSVIPATVCISAQELLMKDTAGRREMLEVFSKHDTDSIIDENPDFEPLRGKLRANTVADLKKSCRDKIKEKTKQRDAYPARIDEVEKQKVDIDLAELELLKNALNEQIAENKAKQANVDKQFEEYDRQSKDILDLQFALSELERKANEENIKKRSDIENFIYIEETAKIDIERKIKDLKEWIRFGEEVINGDKSLEKCREEYTLAYNRVFDENSLVCSYCGQEYQKEEKERLRAKFENEKTEELKRITEKGNALKKRHENAKEELKSQKEELLNRQEILFETEKLISERKKELSLLPQSIDISDREDVKQLKQQIAEKEAAMQKGGSASEIRQQLQDEREGLQRQLNEVQRKFDKAEENNRIGERVEQLRKEQRELSQEIADVEKELSLLQDFEREKARLLEEDLNKNCDYIRFKMSELQQNGELKDVCQILVNGESYDRNLNFSSQLLVHIDICRMFQRIYDVELPILLDNAESIDKDRIPNVSNQLILFMRSDNKELKIETEV